MRKRKEFKVLDPKPGNKTLELINVKFGLLTVESYSHKDKFNNKIWKCKCDCGNDTFVSTASLRKGTTTSCKCNQYKKGKNVHNYSGYEDITGTRWNSIRGGAKARNLSFDISKEDIWKILLKQNYKCALSGIDVSFKNNTASIDRINNDIGYSIDNVWIVHKDINLMRNKFNIEYFKEICNLITKNNAAAHN